MRSEPNHSWGYRGQKQKHSFKLSINAAVFMGVAGNQREIVFDPIEFGIAGPVRTLVDMSEQEKRALCRQYNCKIAGDA